MNCLAKTRCFCFASSRLRAHSIQHWVIAPGSPKYPWLRFLIGPFGWVGRMQQMQQVATPVFEVVARDKRFMVIKLRYKLDRLARTFGQKVSVALTALALS